MRQQALAIVDRALSLAFGRHADAPRHAPTRQRFRAVAGGRQFETFLSRLYGLSWLVFLVAATGGALLVGSLPPDVLDTMATVVARMPAIEGPIVERALVPGLGVVAGALAKRTTIRAGAAVLAVRARKRRERIDRSLPRTVRFMHVLASGTADRRTLLSRVAERERAFGETARAFQRVLGTATVVGSLDDAIGIVARDTPSRRTLAPFLLTMRSHARDGPDALARFLHLESRTLARRGAQRSGAANRYLGNVVRLFVALLVVPVLAVVALAAATGFEETSALPTHDAVLWVREQVLLSPASAVVVLTLGGLASGLVYALRPPGFRWSQYRAPASVRGIVASANHNPASALVMLAPVGVTVAVWAVFQGLRPVASATVGYALFAIPVGLVDWQRARRDAAKDRYLPDLVHAVARQVHRGRSFTEAVEHVAADERLGPLDVDVADLAFDLRVASGDRPVRGAALDRFVDRVGTPLAERTIGMVAGALEAGSQTAAAFEALQSEAGRLYHEERAVRAERPVVLAVGWVASLLVVGIVLAVNVAAVGTTVPGGGAAATTGTRVGAVATVGGPPTFYLLTQAAMLSSGWFAGVAGRGVYEGLLHSGALVLASHLAFAMAGLV